MAGNSTSGDSPAVTEMGPERDMRPIIKRPPAGVSGIVIALGAIVAAALLFLVLDARRRSPQAPATFPTGELSSQSAAPPPLYVPPQVAPSPRSPAPVSSPQPRQDLGPPPPQIVYVPQRTPPTAEPLPPRVDASPALVVDLGTSSAVPAVTSGASSSDSVRPAGEAFGRTRAAMFANPATTVPQGTLIHAVLETGFDSTRPGFARALVQRDVRGFDGSRVLIPKGSRLIGEYSGAASPGQKRALILWSRLIRPDGVTIAIGSPGTDPLGRGGVRARVDSHFLERFAGAILQTVLDIGVNFAGRSSDSPVIVALPGAVHGSTATITRPAEIAPTLKIRSGTSVSVFVARDLDFTGAKERP